MISHMLRQAGGDEDPTDYRMQHRPPDRDGMPLHDLTQNMPADVYTHPHYYSDMSEPSNQEAHSVIRRVRGNPDARVRIYRTLPAEYAHQGFRPGDWVSTSKEYARQHGRHATDPKHDWPVLHAIVRADDLHTDGDDLREYGYNGEKSLPGTVAFKGGYHQEVRRHADGVVRKVVRQANPVKGYSFTGEDHRDYDEQISGAPPHGVAHAWAPDGSSAGHIKFGPQGHEVHIEPEHQHVADELERRMRLRMPKEASMERVAVLQGFDDGGQLRSVASYSGPKLRVYAHVSGNSIDAIHCPFCGSGAVFARSDGTIECSFCTSVYTVQVQPQFAAFPQTAEQIPYQWPGRPGPDQLAGGGDGAMGGFPGPIAGEQDQGGEEGGPEDGNPIGSSDDAGESDGDSGEGPTDKDVPGKAQVGGKDKPPFGKKKSYRTAAGHRLNEDEYLRHLAIGHAHRRGDVALLVRSSR